MPRRPKIDWNAEQERYVAGSETFEEVAVRLGVSKTAVEQRSRLGGGWARLRQEFRERGAARAAELAGETYAMKLRRVSEKATDVATRALDKLAKRLEGDDVKDSDLIAAAKLATSIKLEVSGPDGAPISVEIEDIGKMTDEELRQLAGATA